MRHRNLTKIHYTMQTAIMVVSPLIEETVEWINVLPSEGKLHDSPTQVSPKKPSIRMRHCYRTVNHSDERNFDVSAYAGDIAAFDFALEISILGVNGVILLVDHRRPESYQAAKEILTLIRSYELKAIIAAVDVSPDANPVLMRAELGLLDEELYLRCDLIDPQSVKEVMMTLVRLIPEFANNTRLMDELNQL